MKEANDYELLEYISSGNEEALDVMYEKYKPLIVKKAKKSASLANKYGLDINDLIQEGMLGLTQAINNFDINLDIKFYTFANTCIERKMISCFVNAKRSKNKILNESIALQTETEDPDLENFIGDYSLNPEKIVCDKENENNIIDLLLNELTENEKQVFNLRKSGFTYKEIADILGKDSKQIDNTIQRIKKKYKNIVNNNLN